MTHFLDAMVGHGLGASIKDVPADARQAAKTFILDSIGVGIAGSAAPLAMPVRTAASRWAGGEVGRVWGRAGFRTTPANAAFINGFQIHCQEYDCVHEPAVVHPLATILSAIIAEVDGQERPVSGVDLMMAVIVAVDMAAGIGVSAKSALKFFRPANAGIFGATLGVARLRQLNSAQTKDALGYALAFCSGTMQAHVEGKPTLPIQIANAARGAIMACDLAQSGLEGPHDSLEGPFGYFDLFEDEVDTSDALKEIGHVWRISEVSHKPFPTGRAAQGGISLVQKIKSRGVTADHVDSIILRAPPIIKRLVGRPIRSRLTANYARLCFQYSGALTLINGDVGLKDFTEDVLTQSQVHELGARIQVENDGNPDPAAFGPQTIIATLKTGEVFEETIEHLFGSPDWPMSRDQHLSKFRACCAFGWGEPDARAEDELIQLTDSLETLDDSASLSRLAAKEET